ncbi:uncharacterized protein F5Z01DRAFT_635570 [Emericellopsis atlantica]|uniref:Uncharacterized protein n=1 Tax=Emericellopsis atlantica TaxID=2614577 RepID=A0A9P8CS11_9HYPO|nr:uncharacterized protein F5Z01DRAFT_635570 [Emericellopsis atlantica]KAG9255286.1 hypothetical protein F5Z01DRAFT_635570 [Emericellopsis atlantica]
MPPTPKANYKTYEAQARLLRAIVAAHPEVKWNYKDITECFGSDLTKDALNHRFRRLRAEAVIIAEARQQGLDMKNLDSSDSLPTAQKDVDKSSMRTIPPSQPNYIAKYFGGSTGDGIQFQFRGIKKDADKIRSVADEGGDPNSVPLVGLGAAGASAQSTPSRGPRGGAARATPSTAGGRKRKIKEETPIKAELMSDDEFSSSVNYEEIDREDTPSKRMRGPATTPRTAASARKNGTPSRRAASQAADTIAASAPAGSSTSDEEPRTYVAPKSIFGDGNGTTSGTAGLNGSRLSDMIGATDPYVGAPSAHHNDMSVVGGDDGEI